MSALPVILAATDTVWHYWLAVALAIPAILIPLILGIAYLRVVVMPRYPKKR